MNLFRQIKKRYHGDSFSNNYGRILFTKEKYQLPCDVLFMYKRDWYGDLVAIVITSGVPRRYKYFGKTISYRRMYFRFIAGDWSPSVTTNEYICNIYLSNRKIFGRIIVDIGRYNVSRHFIRKLIKFKTISKQIKTL